MRTRARSLPFDATIIVAIVVVVVAVGGGGNGGNNDCDAATALTTRMKLAYAQINRRFFVALICKNARLKVGNCKVARSSFRFCGAAPGNEAHKRALQTRHAPDSSSMLRFRRKAVKIGGGKLEARARVFSRLQSLRTIFGHLRFANFKNV